MCGRCHAAAQSPSESRTLRSATPSKPASPSEATCREYVILGSVCVDVLICDDTSAQDPKASRLYLPSLEVADRPSAAHTMPVSAANTQITRCGNSEVRVRIHRKSRLVSKHLMARDQPSYPIFKVRLIYDAFPHRCSRILTRQT